MSLSVSIDVASLLAYPAFYFTLFGFDVTGCIVVTYENSKDSFLPSGAHN